MRVGTDVFACLIGSNHVLVGLKTRGTSDPRKHLCLEGRRQLQSGGRHLGLARRASARWSISRCLCRLRCCIESTCTSLVAQLHLEYTWRLHNRQRHLPETKYIIEPTLWRVSSAAKNSLPLFPGISDPALPRLSLRPCRLLRHRRPHPRLRVGLVVGFP